MPTPHAPVVYLFDVDNTLLDNDRVIADIGAFLDREFGLPCRVRYFAIFEALRAQLGYADYLGALQRYRVEQPRDPKLLELSSYLIDYPFKNRLYSGALDVLKHFGSLGPTVILSDGDVVFQPRKVQQSGISDAVDGRVLIYIHKEEMLDDVQTRFPADRYVLVDDKVRLLTACQKILGDRLTTVFPRQGHYALDAEEVANYPTPDVTIERIGDLLLARDERLMPAR